MPVAAGTPRAGAGGLSSAQREPQLDDLADLYAEHTDVRHPLAWLGDTPLRTRAELRAHFADSGARTAGAVEFEPTHANVHLTADLELVIFEFAYAGERTAALSTCRASSLSASATVISSNPATTATTLVSPAHSVASMTSSTNCTTRTADRARQRPVTRVSGGGAGLRAVRSRHRWQHEPRADHGIEIASCRWRAVIEHRFLDSTEIDGFNRQMARSATKWIAGADQALVEKNVGNSGDDPPDPRLIMERPKY